MATPRESIIIGLACAVLDDAVERSKRMQVQTADVRLALRVLQPYCPREGLVAFWEAGDGDNDIGRAQATNAALNRILYLMRRPR